MNKKIGKILISGFSNAGKSTLINVLLKKKVSIVSHKVQTTNKNIIGILNYNDSQLVFIDTPGVITSKKFLSKSMSRALLDVSHSVDINLFVLDSSKEIDDRIMKNIKSITSDFKKNYLVLNKVDLIDKEKLVFLIDKINKNINFMNTFPVSSKKRKGIKTLIEKLVTNIPYGEWLYKDKLISGKDLEFKLSEITREKVFRLINQEIPYSVKIETSIHRLKNLTKVNQTILVKKKSQKAILIGKRGEKIKSIGIGARLEMQKLLKKKVFLDLKVLNNL